MTQVDTREAYVRVEREIGLLLRRSRAISARLSRELHPDLDGAAYGLLALLQDAGPLRASDLVARLGLDKSTVSRQVSTLVALGLVTREADPADGRAVRVRATAKGKRLLQEGRSRRVEALAMRLAALPAGDLATLDRAAEIVDGLARPARERVRSDE